MILTTSTSGQIKTLNIFIIIIYLKHGDSSQNPREFEHLAICLHLLLQTQRIGARGGGQTEQNSVTAQRDMGADLRHIRQRKEVHKVLRGLLTRGDHHPAGGNLPQERLNIRQLHHLEELVRGILLQASDRRSRVIIGDARLLEERHDALRAETLPTAFHEIVLLAEKERPHDPPMVIDEIRVEEVHAPAGSRRRETAEEKHLRGGRQKGLQRMILHRTGRSLNML